MRVTLFQFRCYGEKVFDIEDGLITLISGSSGIGKTTIFEAIYFALYGTLQKVNPHGSDATKVKTSVTVETPTFTVVRRKHPNTLKYTIRGSSFDNLEAQKQIEAEFGPENVWLTTSYLIQNERSPLLSYSNTERMAIIKYLSFHQEDPQIYIERISQELDKLRHQKQTEETKYHQDHQWILREMETNKVSFDQCLTQEVMEALFKEKETLSTKLTEMIQKLTQKTQMDQQKKTLMKILVDLESEISKLQIKETLDNEIQQLSTQAEDLKKRHYQQLERIKLKEQHKSIMEARKKLIDKLREGQKGLDEKFADWSTTKFDSVEIVRQQEAQFSHYQALCKKINVEYQEDKIKTLIVSLQELQVRQKKYERLCQLRSQREQEIKSGESVKDRTVTEDDLSLARKKYEDGARSLDLLSCPKCGQGVRYLNGRLTVAEISPVSPDEIRKLKYELDTLIWLKSHHERLSVLDREIASFGEVVLTPEESKPIDDILQIARTIQFVKEPLFPSSLIQLVKTWHEERGLLDQYPVVEEIEVAIDSSLESQLQQSNQKLKVIQTENDLIKATNAKIKTLKTQFDNRKEELTKIKDVVVDTDPELIRSSLSKIDQQLTQGKRSNDLAALADKHTEHYGLINSLGTDILALESLLKRANTAECTQLESIVQGINVMLNDIVASVFPTSPMTATMSLNKITGTDRLKQVVNFIMSYKDASLTNLRQLSGGEGDRLSFALFLTLSCISGSPILLLDEPFGALDGELRDYCIATLRNVAKGKTILCVGHEEVGGRYDRILTI